MLGIRYLMELFNSIQFAQIQLYYRPLQAL